MLNWIIWNKTVVTLTLCVAQSAGAVEYTDSPLLRGLPPTNEYSVYDSKQSDGTIYQPLCSGRIWLKVNF